LIAQAIDPGTINLIPPSAIAQRRSSGKRYGQRNYKRSLMQAQCLQTLMKDAREGLIR